MNNIIYQNIIDYLLNKQWQIQTKNSKFDIFIPPKNLGFENSYKLYVYNKIDNKYFYKSCESLLETFGAIYDEDLDELTSIILEDKQILSLHIHKDEIINAKPPILYFNKLISRTKDLLNEVANFSILKKQHFFDTTTEEAERYLNYCNFVKNDIGSLITKIELPKRQEIKEETLFNKPIIGTEINENLINISSFINNNILQADDFQINDEFLLKNKNNVSVNVTNKLKSLYDAIEYADIDISLRSSCFYKQTFVKKLTKTKIKNLDIFAKTVKEKVKNIIEEQIFGKIIKLQSKDVTSDNNKILVEAYVKNVKSLISVRLNSEQIKLATDAFKNNKTISITAKIEKEKTQYKIIKLINISLARK